MKTTYLMTRLEQKAFISSKPCRLAVIPRQEFIKHTSGKLSFFFFASKIAISYNGTKAPEEILRSPQPSNFLSFENFEILIFNADDFFLIVAAASLANPMGHHQSSAFAALYQIACAHFPISSALISSGLGRPILWANRHGLHLLKLLKYILDYRHPWIWRTAFTGTGFVI